MSHSESSVGPRPARLEVGQRIGRYDILGVLGIGGMGIVYLAHDSIIDRDVALKVLSGDLATNEISLQRFQLEAQSAGKLHHPHTISLFEVGQEGAIHYLVMEFAPGGSVAAKLEQSGPFSVLEATRIVADACKGLATAHSLGLIHRDIKPANLLFAGDGSVKVADFGLARPSAPENRRLTLAGHVVGSPHYMSPEQCESRTVDHRSDIYSLGATYYSLLTGMDPYASEGTAVRIMFAHCQGPILNPRDVNPAVPEACAAIIARAMAKQPEQRYQSAVELLDDLNAVIATLSGATKILLPSESAARLAVTPAAVAPQPVRPTARLRPWPLIAIGALLLFTSLIVLMIAKWRSPTDSGPPQHVSTAASRPTIPAPGGQPIKVGVLQSMTGTMASSGSAVIDATLLAIDEINQSGGLLGRPVEALVRDGSSTPEIFAREAERLISEDHVSVIFGCWTSSARKTVVPIVERYNNLLVYPVQYEGLEESPNVMYLGATPNQQIIPAVKWAYAFLNKRRFFFVGSDYVFPRTAHEIVKDQLKELGAELAGEEFVTMGSTELQLVVSRIVAAKPDVILNTINGDSNVVFFRELRAAGIRPQDVPTISFSIGEEELRHLNVAQMAGDYAAWNYFQSVDSVENRQFVERFRARFGPQRVLTDPMESAYNGVKLWAAAVSEAATDEPSAARHAMRAQRTRGPGGEIRIDPGTQHAFKTPRIGQISTTGQFKIVWTAAEPGAPEPYPSGRSAEEWKVFLHDLYRSWGEQWTAPEK
jgi:urea transport system substrate-binding protein